MGGLGRRHGDHDQPDLHRARDPASAGRCGRGDAGHGPRLRGGRARRPRARACATSSSSARETCLSLEDVMGQPLEAQAPVDLEEPRRRAALFQRHDGAAQGRDADPSQPRGQCAAIGCGGRDHRRDTAIAFLPFFHIYGMTVLMNLFLERARRLVTMPRFDLELFLRLIQEHHGDAALHRAAGGAGAGQAPDGGRVRHVLGRGSVFRRRTAGPRDRDRGGRAAGRAVGAGLRHDRDEPDQPHDDRRQRAPRLERAGGAVDGVPHRGPLDAEGHGPRARRASSGCAGRR
jgi:acyl-CoA synthetase (AMP-forming)/AMP-acid ligase II